MEQGTAGRLPRRERLWARAAVAMGLLVLAVAAVLALRVVPADQAEEAAYLAAPTCGQSPGNPECVSLRTTSVADTDKGIGKSGPYKVAVPAPDGGEQWITLQDGSVLYDNAHLGDPLTLQIWRGQVRAVTWDGYLFRAKATPINSYATALGFATGLIPAGIALIAAGTWWLTCAHRHPRTSPWQSTLLAGAGISAALAAGMPVAFVPLPATTAWPWAATCYAVATITSLVCRVFLARAERRGDAVPVLPTPAPDNVDPWVIEVSLPFEKDFSGSYLAVTSRGRYMTPDHTGHFARRRLPEPLVWGRARRQLRTDGPSGRHDDYIAECRTGDRTLLFRGRLPQLDQLAAALTPDPQDLEP